MHSWNARSIISQSKSKISLLLTFALIIGRHCERVGELFFVACHTAFPVFASERKSSAVESYSFWLLCNRQQMLFPFMHTHTRTHRGFFCCARVSDDFESCRKQSRKNGGREKESLTLFE